MPDAQHVAAGQQVVETHLPVRAAYGDDSGPVEQDGIRRRADVERQLESLGRREGVWCRTLSLLGK
jgi:hypothetical protein